MEASVQKLLSDKLYDKRKAGALELEGIIRDAVLAGDHDRIARIVHQLCHDYAYAVHQPHARNGGLIGLAAAAIALGGDVARYLREIVPPVLACFTDQDARVRYYACESMYNIAKVAKGEILIYFNDVFDALCKLAADTELSVKNGAELLDRLVKDIVSESAASYVSILQPDPDSIDDTKNVNYSDNPTAFSLPRFIPLLQERIHVLNPHTRTFLVTWLTLLDSIPDLELVAYLPAFLGGLLKFLSDNNPDVHTTTKTCLDRFLSEIKRTAALKRGIAESRKSHGHGAKRASISSGSMGKSPRDTDAISARSDLETGMTSELDDSTAIDGSTSDADSASYASSTLGDNMGDGDDDGDDAGGEEWIPGQDVQIDHAKILEILLHFLRDSAEEEIQMTTLRWIESFFDICPEDLLPFVPQLLSQVLPALSHDVEQVRQSANRVNNALTTYIMSLPEEPTQPPAPSSASTTEKSNTRTESTSEGRRQSALLSAPRKNPSPDPVDGNKARNGAQTPPPPPPPPAPTAPSSAIAPSEKDDADQQSLARQPTDFDYEAAVNALTLQFLNEHEATRVAALAWLIMLHRKSPRKTLTIHDSTFPALLKTLSDPADAVVTRDLLLLSQISKNSDDSYFTSFMVNLLKLFATDRKLLETRGNLIIRQLCLSLSAERIYRTLADCLDKDEDVEFASIMIQNLNNNLITAPEMADMRKRLRNLETRDGQTFFVALFRSWCHNAVATFSLCLLAQAYEQAYNLLQIIAELEMTVNMLIQIDKLVQLLESPVFTYLRLQLLEPERFPHLYKCMYGLLMLLPQSSAFAALKNRLNSVSAIGYLHTAPRTNPSTPNVPTFADRPNRLKSREEPGIKWTELLEKFRTTQERARRAQQRPPPPSGLPQGITFADPIDMSEPSPKAPPSRGGAGGLRPTSAASSGKLGSFRTGTPDDASRLSASSAAGISSSSAAHQKGKSSLSNLGRFARSANRTKK